MNRKIALLAGAAVVAVLGAWYLALWKPAGHQLAAARQQLAAAQSSRQEDALQHAALKAKAAKLPSEEAKAGLLAAAAPAGPDIAGVIDQINAIATSAGVSWQSEAQAPSAVAGAATATTAGKAAAVPPSLTLTLAVTGTYHQILDFVHRLQTMPRLAVVTTLSLGGSGAASSAPGSPAAAPASTALTTQVGATIYQEPTPLPRAPEIKG